MLSINLSYKYNLSVLEDILIRFMEDQDKLIKDDLNYSYKMLENTRPYYGIFILKKLLINMDVNEIKQSLIKSNDMFDDFIYNSVIREINLYLDNSI